MTEKRFKECLIEFDKAKQKLEREKRTFELDIKEFMRSKGIPVKVLFFGNTFGLDIKLNDPNFTEVPLKIPLNILSEFCNEFDCEFEYHACDGYRWIFSFNGLSVGY